MNPVDNMAPISKRIWSYVIDDLVMSVLFIAIFFEKLATLSSPEDATRFVTENYLILIILKVVYHTLFTWQNGKTLGKQIMKIRSVSAEDGSTLTLPVSFLRACVRIIDEAIFYIGFIAAFFTPTRQTIHDRISKSVVIND